MLLLTRRHPIYLLKSILIPLAAIGAALALAVLIALDAPNRAEFWTGWFWIPAGLVVLALLWIGAMQQEWANDRYIVTDHRAIALKSIYRVFEQRRESDLHKLQDVTVNVESPLAYLFGYGDVVIATAGSGNALVFAGVARPDAVKEVIFETSRQLRERDYAEEQRLMRERLQRELLGQRGVAE